jgi:hypothetical protein
MVRALADQDCCVGLNAETEHSSENYTLGPWATVVGQIAA